MCWTIISLHFRRIATNAHRISLVGQVFGYGFGLDLDALMALQWEASCVTWLNIISAATAHDLLPASPLNWLLVSACPWVLHTLCSPIVSVGHKPATRMRTSTHLLIPEPLGFTHPQELTSAFLHKTPCIKHICQSSAANCHLRDTVMTCFISISTCKAPASRIYMPLTCLASASPSLLSPRGDGVWKAKLSVPSMLPVPH